MIALHGTWVVEGPRQPAQFVLWAEVRAGRPRAHRRPVAGAAAGRAPRHPFAARPAQLAETLHRYCARGVADSGRPGEALARLPTAGGHPLPSPVLARGDVAAEPPSLATWRLPALSYDAVPATQVLLALAALEPSPDLHLGDDLRLWIAATRCALELVHRQRFIPTLEREGEHYLARWRPVLDEAADEERLAALAAAMPAVCRALSWTEDAPPPGPRRLLGSYVNSLVDGVARSVGRAGWAGSRAASKRSLAASWWSALFGLGPVEGQPERLRAFQQQLRSWTERGREHVAETFRVCFRLSPPAPDSSPPLWRLDYLLQATDDPSLLVPVGDVWRQRGATARFLDRRLVHPQERLLAGLGRAARLFPPLEAGLRQARPVASTLTTPEAHQFLREAALTLGASGFGVLVPGLDSRLRLRLRLKGGGPGSSGGSGGAGAGAFSRESLVAFDWEVALGEQPLTREEFEHLARLKAPLVQVRGQWVELQPEQVEQTLAFLERRAAEGELTLQEALRLALAPDATAETGLPIESVEAEGWVEDLLGELRDGQRRQPAAEPEGFAGTLRPYQKAGVSWLASLHRYGLGACLADDMGLGKTVQVIALLLRLRQADGGGDAPPAARRGPTLIVCPTSVVGNWRRELERFAPALRLLVHHGAGRARRRLADQAAGHDVVLSTYALLPRDEAELRSVSWQAVVLDEAQNVKNATTRTAQVARALPAGWRAALTGTPVENRLAELWSLFQFLNPGYLGSAEAFRKRFANPIERTNDAEATERLKRLVAPFVLRRQKTDRTIIQDLPEKLEMKAYCPLTREQATLYEAVVRDSLGEIEAAEGIERRGQVLAALTRLKQVCNHPALFLHDRSVLEGRSGKLTRLEEMLEEALSVDDRTLIFTQYAEMGRLLEQRLAARFGEEVLFLHGGTPAATRDRLVDRFQRDDRHAPRLFVLSIKAGGTGLNLTRANRVFHFDRWWNPAVENQATDRAYRIGQTRRVQVHKLVCAGTFEEQLDELIERKLGLAQAIVGTSEAWLTEMSTAELRELFALRRSDGGGPDAVSRRSRRSEWSDWEDRDYPRPRRPADGIRARSQRGRFGATWWAGRWLAALERLVDSGRLSRGRSYARSGQVTRLDAGPAGVDARVQGSRPTPYRVTMRFRALSEAEWDAVADAMAAQALYAARLLSGEMPEQIEEAFRAAGVTLFPADEGDLETDCTCPDWANPCKHVAAAFYLLGERFDADPFLMFELRGRTKEQIVEALRARRAGGPLGPEPGAAGAAPPEPPETDAAGAAEEPVPLLPDADSGAGGPAGRPPAEAFWTAPADPDALAVTFRPPQVDALPIKLLGAPPFWQEWPEFAGAAEQAYRAIGERAERLANEGSP